MWIIQLLQVIMQPCSNFNIGWLIGRGDEELDSLVRGTISGGGVSNQTCESVCILTLDRLIVPGVKSYWYNFCFYIFDCTGDPPYPQVPAATQGSEHNVAKLPTLLEEEMSLPIPCWVLRLQGATICIPYQNCLVQNMSQGAEKNANKEGWLHTFKESLVALNNIPQYILLLFV